MKKVLSYFLIFSLSACTVFEGEIFQNNDKDTNPKVKQESRDLLGPGYGFWKAIQSVKRVQIEVSDEYKKLDKNSRGYTSWIGHSSFLINNYDLNIITDPIFSNRASPFSFFGPKRLIEPAINYKDLPDIDVIVISHNHYDHLDIKSIKNLSRLYPNIIFLVPLKLKKWFQRIGAKNVYEFNWWEEKTIGNTTFTFIPVQHWSRRGLFDKNKTLWGGWWIENSDIKLVHLGDTGYTKDFLEVNKRLGSPDVAFIPIGAYSPRRIMKKSHMNPTEALNAALDLNAKRSIAMHWGTFILTTEPIEEPKVLLDKLIIVNNLEEDFFKTISPGQIYLFDKEVSTLKK
jgi:N-acyl-phosphatidylethanolamine-hydrolysing phospholipase D